MPAIHDFELLLAVYIFAAIFATSMYLGWLQGLPSLGIVLLIIGPAVSSLMTVVGLAKLEGLMIRPVGASLAAISGLPFVAIGLGTSMLLLAIFADRCHCHLCLGYTS